MCKQYFVNITVKGSVVVDSGQLSSFFNSSWSVADLGEGHRGTGARVPHGGDVSPGSGGGIIIVLSHNDT